jgi:outer membrane protein OmpA-like peptidoglycan-associated protein
MNIRSKLIALFLVTVLSGSAYAQDVEGASDHPAIGRYEGSIITNFETSEYDSQRMLTNVDPVEFADFEGAVTRLIYSMPEGASVIQIARSYEQELTGEGFDTLVNCRNRDCGRALFSRDLREAVWTRPLGVGALSSNEIAILTLAREGDGSPIHVQIVIASGKVGRGINVNVVEGAAFENKMLDAAAMAKSILETGRVALDNIYFDFNQATLTAESDEALAEMAKLLADNAGIRVYVVGHTDNVGDYEFNLDLSRRRAKAVADALVGKYGVSPDRVVPAGVGPLAPVASNATSHGQAENRRVELVQR